MKEIILPTELMAFFVLNMFAHDSALHDFATSSELGKGRVLNVLKVTPDSPGAMKMEGVVGKAKGGMVGKSMGGMQKKGIWKGIGGGDEALNAATISVFKSTVYPSLRTCLLSTGFFDITRNDATKSDSFIIVDAKLAMGVVFDGRGVVNMGIAPGFIYLPEKTYSPFEFEVVGQSAIDRNGYE
jgi:hypothetical protein